MVVVSAWPWSCHFGINDFFEGANIKPKSVKLGIYRFIELNAR